MRFIHTADLHIGARPDSDRPWGKARAEAVRHSLERFIDLCLSEKIDLLLIAGDLFHRPPTEGMLKEAAYQFARLKETQVVLIAGNHDFLRPGCAYSEYAFPPHVHLIRSPGPKTLSFPELGLDITGFSYEGETLKENPLTGLTPSRNGLRHFLMFHGGDASHAPFAPGSLKEAGWDYIALGHIHKPSLNEALKAAMPGSPEPLDKSESGAHGYYQGEMNERGLSLAWKSFSRFTYTDLRINITPDTTQGALEALLKKRLQGDYSTVYRLILTGRRDPAIHLDTQALLSLGPVSDAVDETLPDYPWEELEKRPEHDMVRRVIMALSPLKGEEDAPLKQKALYYALDALLTSEKGRKEAFR